jgi:hypothetical protein
MKFCKLRFTEDHAMFSRNGLKLVTTGALAIAMVSLPAFAGAARDRSAVTTEFSAQGAQVDPKKKAAPVAPKQAPARVAPTQAPVRVVPRQAPVHVAPTQTAPRVIQRQVTPQGGTQKNLGSQKYTGPKVVAPVTTTPRIIGQKTGTPVTTRKVYTPRGDKSRVVSAARIRGVPARGVGRTMIHSRNYSVWRGGHRVRHGNRWRTFVALGTLGVLAIGAAEYYPYAYIEAPEPYCDGLTEDGCQLVFDEVETMEGDAVGQCVAYCPWQ